MDSNDFSDILLTRSSDGLAAQCDGKKRNNNPTLLPDLYLLPGRCYFQSSCPQVVSPLKQDNIKDCSPVRVNDIELQVCQVKCSTGKGGLRRIKEQRGVLLAAA